MTQRARGFSRERGAAAQAVTVRWDFALSAASGLCAFSCLFARICRLSARFLAPSARGGRAAGLLRGGPGLQLRRGLPRAIPMRALRRSTLRLGARAGARCGACGSRCKSSRLRAACAGGAGGVEEAPLGVRFSPGGARGALGGGRHTREANAPAARAKIRSRASSTRRGAATGLQAARDYSTARRLRVGQHRPPPRMPLPR